MYTSEMADDFKLYPMYTQRDKNLQNRPFQQGNGRKNPEEEANSWLGPVRKYCTDEDQTKIGTYT